MIRGWKNNPQWRVYYHGIALQRAQLRSRRLELEMDQERMRITRDVRNRDILSKTPPQNPVFTGPKNE